LQLIGDLEITAFFKFDGICLFACFRGISWETKEKVHQANYFGSLTQASTVRLGSHNGKEVFAPFKSLVPLVRFLHISCMLDQKMIS
jgi:hypothetical protein